MALLQVENMTHYFGGLRAVHNFDLEIEPGQIRGLIGPNGAGKTTIFNLITGIYRPSEGNIILEGQRINGRAPHDIASLGIGRTFQNMLLWRHMSVLEHVKMARYSKFSYGLFGAFLDSPKRRQEETEATDKAMEYMELFHVDKFADQLVVNLPFGAQRRVEMARALAMEPKVLLLDEPTVGMTPEEMRDIIFFVRKAHEQFNLAISMIT